MLIHTGHIHMNQQMVKLYILCFYCLKAGQERRERQYCFGSMWSQLWSQNWLHDAEPELLNWQSSVGDPEYFFVFTWKSAKWQLHFSCRSLKALPLQSVHLGTKHMTLDKRWHSRSANVRTQMPPEFIFGLQVEKPKGLNISFLEAKKELLASFHQISTWKMIRQRSDLF